MVKKGSTKAGSLPGYASGGRVAGSTQAGGQTEIMGMGAAPIGSTKAGVNMAPSGGTGPGSTYPNMMKGGSKPKGTNIPNIASLKGGKVKGSSVAAGKLANFHATRGASKL